jgi:hypothetical protein
MLAARLVASRVIGPGGRRNVELTREPSQQALGRVLLRAQAEARVSQEAELDRRPEPVGSAAPRRPASQSRSAGESVRCRTRVSGSDGMPNRRACSSAVKSCRRGIAGVLLGGRVRPRAPAGS